MRRKCGRARAPVSLVGLEGIYDARRGFGIKLHAPGCSMLNVAKNPRGHLHATGPATADDLEDWKERGFKISVCKCARGGRRHEP